MDGACCLVECAYCFGCLGYGLLFKGNRWECGEPGVINFGRLGGVLIDQVLVMGNVLLRGVAQFGAALHFVHTAYLY
jgi:hypothetical protein